MLSADDRAQMLRDVAEMQADSGVLLMETTAEVWRSPEPVNGKRGPVALVQIEGGQPYTVAIHIRAFQVEGTEKPDLAPVGLGGQRITHIGRTVASADIRMGDELRIDGKRYAVEGSSTKRVLRTCTLSWIKS